MPLSIATGEDYVSSTIKRKSSADMFFPFRSSPLAWPGMHKRPQFLEFKTTEYERSRKVIATENIRS